MGYTHYWERTPVINRTRFFRIVEGFRLLHGPLCDLGVPLAGSDGTGSPILTYENVEFNGVQHCGHPSRSWSFGWPAPDATGVSDGTTDSMSGTLLRSRACNGDCSHEPFQFPRLETVDLQNATNGKLFRFSKTAYKPYDLAVCSFLVIAKHHLGSSLLVYSDGMHQHFQDAMHLCEEQLGYGSRFVLDVEPK